MKYNIIEKQSIPFKEVIELLKSFEKAPDNGLD